jgi:hypothetical protein
MILIRNMVTVVLDLNVVLLYLGGALFSSLFGLVMMRILWVFAQNRVKRLVFGMANEYVDGFMQNLEKNPELLANLLKPVGTRLLGQYGLETGSNRPKSFKILGFPVPEPIMNLIGEMAAKEARKRLGEAGNEAGSAVWG